MSLHCIDVTGAVHKALCRYRRTGRWDQHQWQGVHYCTLPVISTHGREELWQSCFCAEDIDVLADEELPGGQIEGKGRLDVDLDEEGIFVGWKDSFDGKHSAKVATDYVTLWRITCNMTMDLLHPVSFEDVIKEVLCLRKEGLRADDFTFAPWMLDLIGTKSDDWELLKRHYPKLRELLPDEKMRLSLVYRASVRDILSRSSSTSQARARGSVVVVAPATIEGIFGGKVERSCAMTARHVVGTSIRCRLRGECMSVFVGRNDLGFADMFLASMMPQLIDWCVVPSPTMEDTSASDQSALPSLSLRSASKRRRRGFTSKSTDFPEDVDGGGVLLECLEEDRLSSQCRRLPRQDVAAFVDMLNGAPAVDCRGSPALIVNQQPSGLVGAFEQMARGSKWEHIIKIFKAGMRHG